MGAADSTARRHHLGVLPGPLLDVMSAQAGVLSRRQVLEYGLDDNDLERLLRRKEWARVYPGVYVDHTGALTQTQRWWAAVQWGWPAVLYGETALLAHGVRPTWNGRTSPHQTTHIAVHHARRVRDREDVKVHRVVDLDSVAQWHLSPPRMRLEPAVVAACSTARTEDDALALAADVCQQRRSTPERLLVALDTSAGGRTRVRHGAELRVVLHDVACGTMSLLEHRHLVAVERAHGLPRAVRQRREPRSAAGSAGAGGSSGSVYRDARYDGFGVVVELDGRLGHEWTADRWDDMDRDLDAGADGTLSLRMGWRHVSATGACRSAIRLGRVLRSRGWRDQPRPCGPGCPVSAFGGTPPAPGAGDLPA